MSQFDVYENKNDATRRAYPYLLNIQSEVLSELSTRIVLPMAREADLKANDMERLTPKVEYQGETLMVMTPQVAAVSRKILAEPVGSLAHMRAEIIGALDFAVGGV
jgi:toxin CcdB